MSTNYITTSKGEVVKFSDLKRRTPSSVYFSSLHDRVCLNIAKRKISNTDSDDFKLYVNLLILKSSKVKELTSLIFLITHNVLSVSEIRCSYIEKSFFDDFICLNYNIKYTINFKQYDFIDIKYKYIIFPVKIILHKIYRLLKNKVEYKKSLIKTYIEDTINFYPKQIQNSTIFIYPFNLNFNRQRKFIEYCKKNYPNNYSLMGNPYSLFGYLLGMITKDGDFNVIEAEKKAYMIHSHELLKFNIKELYTLDEFETASFVMNGNLIRNNVFVLNKTHGVGGYCLYLNYSVLEVFTSRQYERYTKWNPHIRVLFQKINTFENKECKDKGVKLVFMHGNMDACGLYYEEELEQKIIRKLKEISLNLNVDYFIKFHPNTTDKAKLKYKDLEIKEVTKIEDIENPLFFTIFSTSFYDFLKFGPFIFLSDDFFKQDDIFGRDMVACYNYNSAEEIIKHSIVYENYKHLHKSQIELLNSR
ncbi:hypothetical protein [Campylobacter showae]|uniref:hypothetical protein n=4 Tax=Campylobacter showae TaxID=204 RepID=UPI00106A6186|nr:hypothetical protein [Campylobacter showae]